VFNVECDIEAKVCLTTFGSIRDSLSKELELPMESSARILEAYDGSKKTLPPHGMIIVEVRKEKFYSTTFEFLMQSKVYGVLLS
jgi:hypothetical protein